MAPAHRHAASVPLVEIADDTDPARIWRPDGEDHSLGTVMGDRVCAEFLVAGVVAALDQQMDVEVAEHWREAVDVLEFVPVPAPLHPQPIAERVALRDVGGKQTLGTNGLR